MKLTTIFLVISIITTIAMGMENNNNAQANLEYKITSNNCGLIIDMFLDHKQIGFAVSMPERSFLSYMEINKNLRGKGYGSQLFHKAMQELKNRGCHKVNWLARGYSIEFYLKNGATFVDQVKGEHAREYKRNTDMQFILGQENNNKQSSISNICTKS